jgi:hypothetical protein
VDDDLFSMLDSGSKSTGTSASNSKKKTDNSLFNIDDYISSQQSTSKGGLFD